MMLLTARRGLLMKTPNTIAHKIQEGVINNSKVIFIILM